MGNMPDINKRQVGVRLRLELLKKIEKLAKANGRATTTEIIILLEAGTFNVVLDSKDYKEIANEVKENEQKRNNPRL